MKIFTVISKILSVVLAMVCIMLVFVLGKMSVAKMTGDPLPMVFGRGNAMVMSGSMEPTIPIGSMIIIHKHDSYAPDDIITYDENSTLVTHRLISIDGDTAITKGDANNAQDSPIQTSQIRGEVTAVLPNAGKVLLWMQSPLRIFIILLLGITVQFLLGGFSKRKQKKTKS